MPVSALLQIQLPQPGPALVNVVAPLAIAGLAGLAVGLEREWSGHASGPGARFAGLRTMFLLGLLGGIAGLLLAAKHPAPATALVLGGAALVVAGYVAAVRQPDAGTDGTTEAAALMVLALGMLAGLGYLAVTGGTAAVVVLALREKTRLQRLVQRIDEIELRAAFQFAVLALVVLPLLPEGPFGPLGGIRPRALWTIVLLFSGLSFVGYLAQRIAGPGIGYPLTGTLGGLVSSTVVTLQFSRQSRREPKAAVPLAIGVLGASTVLLVRVTLLAVALRAAVAAELLRYLALPSVLGLAALAVVLLRHAGRATPATSPPTGSPLRLGPAIRLTLLFQGVLMLMAFVRERFGARGILPSAALIGLTDVDALVLSMTSGAGATSVTLAAKAIAIGILSNTVLKVGLAAGLGGARFRWLAAAALVGLGAATAVALWIAW
jgi:uncharacterized membrane protein (DUF4010 family)